MNFSYLLGLGGVSRPEAPVVNTQSTRMIFTYTALSGATGVCVGVLHAQTRSIVILRLNIITRGWVMIDLKAQLYWARVERWIAAALLLEVSILLNTQRDSANSLYSGAPYPTQSLKNLHRRKGGGYFGLCIKIYRAHGSLYAKRTFNRIAANDC